ncbi:MAG: regulatory protein RecX, partial [Nevskiales bacterium]
MKRKPERGEGATPDSPGPPDPREIRERALGLLARREHAVLELKRKLLQRGYPADLIASTLAGLSAEGLLSETRYADEWARSRVARGQGPVRIRAELRQSGLTDAQVQRALAGVDADWGRLATDVRRKRFGNEPPATLAERARQTRFLESRGFTADHIRQAMGDAGEPSP